MSAIVLKWTINVDQVEETDNVPTVTQIQTITECPYSLGWVVYNPT